MAVNANEKRRVVQMKRW